MDLKITEPPVACSLTKAEFGERKQLVARMTRSVVERQALPDGVLLRFAAAPGTLGDLAGFVDLERACCPFIRFRIDVEPGGAGIVLQMTGSDEALAVIRELVPVDSAVD